MKTFWLAAIAHSPAIAAIVFGAWLDTRRTKAGGKMRTVGIWIFGLLASLFVGVTIGSQLSHDSNGADYAVPGAIATMLTFACLRLWISTPPGASHGRQR